MGGVDRVLFARRRTLFTKPMQKNHIKFILNNFKTALDHIQAVFTAVKSGTEHLQPKRVVPVEYPVRFFVMWRGCTLIYMAEFLQNESIRPTVAGC